MAASLAACDPAGDGKFQGGLERTTPIIPLQPHVRDVGEADPHRRAVPRFLGGSESDDIAPIACPQVVQSGIESPELLGSRPPLLLGTLVWSANRDTCRRRHDGQAAACRRSEGRSFTITIRKVSNAIAAQAT